MKKKTAQWWAIVVLSAFLTISLGTNVKLWRKAEFHYGFAVYAQDAFRGALGHDPSWAEFCLYSTKGGRMRCGE